MSLDDFDDVPEAKSPLSKSATETPRSARSRATPAPAMPPPMTTASSADPSSPDSLLISCPLRSAIDHILDRSYHVIGSDGRDSGIVSARDAAENENGGETESPSHRDVR